MNASCPSCGAAVAISEGEDAVCPACLTEFRVGAGRVHPSWDVLLVDGTRTEGLGRYAVRERVYTQRIPINARVRPTGEDEWVGIHEVDDFMRIYALLGVEPPLQSGVRRIAGWRAASEGGAPVPVTAPRPKAPPPKVPPVPVVAEGADVRVVAGHDPEEDVNDGLELELDPLPEVEPFAKVETAPAPRSMVWALLLIPVALAALACAGALVWFS